MRVGRNTGCLVTGLALLAGVAACGGGDDGNARTPSSGGSSASGSSTDSGSQPSAAAPITFASTSGQSAVLLRTQYQPGVQLKVIDTALAGQVGGQTAKPDSHLFAAYVVVKPELADRGVADVELKDLHLRFTLAGGECDGPTVTTAGKTECTHDSYGATQADIDEAPAVAEKWPSSSLWAGYTTSRDLQENEEAVGVVVWSVSDSARIGDAELCDGLTSTDDEAKCLPIKTPERTF